MKTISLVYSFFISIVVMAQPILNKRYDLGADAVIFSSVIATDSCYYVSGMQAHNQGNGYQEGVFIRYNLNGSIDEIKVIEDNNTEYIFWESPNLIQTLDNNFAQTFTIDPIGIVQHFGFVKFDANGDTLLYKTYLDIYNENGDNWIVRCGGLFQDPVDSCYYGTVDTQRYSDLVSGIALFKLSKTGELLWYTIFYGGVNYFSFNRGESLIKVAPDRLVIGGYRIHDAALNEDWRFNSKIIVTDTSGNQVQTMNYNQDLLAIGFKGLTQTVDGGYLFAGLNGEFTHNGNSMHYWGRVMKLDSNFIEEWRIEKGIPTSSNLMGFDNVLKISDSTFLAVGRTIDTVTYPLGNTAGWLLKFNINGDILWERFYQKVLADENTNAFPRHILYDVDITSDSGFVMVGQSRNFENTTEPLGQLGWLVKADKHGCLVPNCQQYDNLSVTTPQQPEIGLEVFPNPVSNELFIYYTNSNHQPFTQAVLYNSNGQQVLNFSIPTSNTTYMLDVSNLTKGIYFLKIADSDSERVEKVVIK